MSEQQLTINPEKIFTLDPGERALIVGQTGMGKTAFACYMLKQHSRVPVIIYDTKIEPKFSKLPKSVVVNSYQDLLKQYRKVDIDYIVFRPSIKLANDPEYLDHLLLEHYEHLKYADCYIDELYMFGIGARPGAGITALLTRGRSRNITTIMSTQRPAWIPKITITESQRFYIFSLIDKNDVKRLGDVIPNFEDTFYENPLPKYAFFYYEVGASMTEAVKVDPVPLDASMATGYVDEVDAPRVRWF